jgi:hypothetical protein
MTHRILLSAVILSTALHGCAKKPNLLEAEGEVQPKDIALQVRSDVPQGIVATATEPTSYDQGVGIHARGSGQTLLISLRNKTGRTIQVIPLDFAVIAGPERADLIRISPAEAAILMPDSELRDGELMLLQIRINRPVDLAGKRLVYNNPRDGVTFFVPIE